jgi:thiamine-phosphate pyrophosphorylase
LSLALKKPIVCYVTDRKALGPAGTPAGVRERVRMALAAGADWIQIREKDLAGRAMLGMTRDAVALASAAGRTNAEETRSVQTCVIVNDRIDIAIASGAAGAHLGRKSLPAREAVRWCHSRSMATDFLIGVSCHSPEEARAAESSGASYIFFGPVFETPSKRAFGAAQGIARLAELCRGVRVPVIAIGGVNEENGGECVRVGAAGIAAIRLFQEAGNEGALKDAISRLHSSGSA